MEHWTVPGYAHTRELGANSSGRTVLATHVATGVPVVIKYLAPDLCGDEAYRDRYRAGARRLVSLASPHVAALYEYVEADEGVAAVREYVAGASLRAVLAGGGTLTPEAALTVLKGGLLGLAAGATVGARHGDYRAEQVLVDRHGQTRLTDFRASTSPRPSPLDPSSEDAAYGDAPYGAASSENTSSEDTSSEDTSAAVTTFVECLLGPAEATRPPGENAALVPKRLRDLLPALADPDRDVLARELEAHATRAYGDGWEARGRRRLARCVARCVRADRRGRA